MCTFVFFLTADIASDNVHSRTPGEAEDPEFTYKVKTFVPKIHLSTTMPVALLSLLGLGPGHVDVTRRIDLLVALGVTRMEGWTPHFLPRPDGVKQPFPPAFLGAHWCAGLSAAGWTVLVATAVAGVLVLAASSPLAALTEEELSGCLLKILLASRRQVVLYW